ncbi:hypothetical protein Bhyg_03834 [Pseudolycoriella hygida]|uniref:Uncharacterized protein n=1 Tax=Pseudolycoriella hygida TaxID=35572 RepID=A0A9Q0NFK0_9DIPT|nr:hypothetical protein Bhyg_03834 [Pseudolycoriella hygida]
MVIFHIHSFRRTGPNEVILINCASTGHRMILFLRIILSRELATAGFGDLLASVINTCSYSACENHPKCFGNYEAISTTREGCSGFKEKKYCCPPGLGPQCYYTGCGGQASCGANYRELDRTKSGCSGFSKKAFCCKITNLPYCFDLNCPEFAEPPKSCPSEYHESRRAKGRSAGCDSAFAERITCCLGDGNRRNSGIQNSNTLNNTEVITETKTLEDGTVQTVTRTKSFTKSSGGLFSYAESPYSSLFKILLVFPILIAIL